MDLDEARGWFDYWATTSGEEAEAARVLRAELDRLGERITELEAECARLSDAAADAVVRQAHLKGMSVEDGAALLELESPREIVIAWVWAARQMLGDAPNYSETRIDFPKHSMEVKAAGEVDRYVFTVQRAGKVTPHEARMAAEARITAALALADESEKAPLLGYRMVKADDLRRALTEETDRG
jgi:hypothetical protein